MRRFLFLFLLGAGLVAGSPLVATAQSGTRTFPETGHTVSGLFLDYWTTHGALPQQGFPISEEMAEKSDLNGQTYTVQYFERAVFEKHPENKPPYDVLLSQLGTFRYRAKYPAGAPGQQASTGNPRHFAETGKTLGGAFRAYWETHGGLAQQGFPISEEFTEVSDLNGQPYTVQYFERAVFEKHPENKPPYDVLLSQLGTFQYRAKYGSSGPPVVATMTPLPVGPLPTATPVASAPTPTHSGTNCLPVAPEQMAPIAHSGPVEISNLQYYTPEYIEIHNTGSAEVSLAGWVIHDKNETSQRYTFPAGTTLAAGASIQVYTEPGHPYTLNRLTGIWNDCGDAAVLQDASGAVVATYAYLTHLAP